MWPFCWVGYLIHEVWSAHKSAYDMCTIVFCIFSSIFLYFQLNMRYTNKNQVLFKIVLLNTQNTVMHINVHLCALKFNTHIYGPTEMTYGCRTHENINETWKQGYFVCPWLPVQTVNFCMVAHIYTLLCSLQLNFWSHRNDGWGLKTMSKKYCWSLA